MMRTIALVNQKGGVGKTTTAVNLGAGLARLGKRVILVDVDPQANATLALGLTMKEVETSVYEILRGEAKASDAIVERVTNLLLLPSRLDLAGIEMELAQTIGRETVLREAVKDLPAADYLIVDCPPSLGLLNINALTCVHEVFIPMQCEFFALQGIAMLTRTVGLVQKRLNPELKLTGVIPCLFDARKGLSREVLSEIERHFGDRVFKARIRANVRLAEAPSHGKTIFEYAPESHGAADYLALAREVAGLPAEVPPEKDPPAKAGLPAEPPPAPAPAEKPETTAPPPEPKPRPQTIPPTPLPDAGRPPEAAPAGTPTPPPPKAKSRPRPRPRTVPPTPSPAAPPQPAPSPDADTDALAKSFADAPNPPEPARQEPPAPEDG